ncbi:hypothetical protein PHYBLDRAFT_183810 [Phycomyces blakesleeanus NRRL 1555(-)]|uniref:Phosphatidylinositol-glycan-specific phospholipase D n=1 Tax=Phycomyces blakesleeanus (strain ATCC 8743b / DSM 1359 / FGSC 10004 / NBRC 33097 / NRRL 1555) TaxID=763407 RepID=A0A167JUK8_PHYB8|nr:hypothetical protein PHYBLDRAFT_183810 [Phycomyces blakesleeanus NRRL 1555(-)]OAD66737.1 hypothetical protein PHYBLDRAFT_183810 [Phycomyces blakesleeanus NRRL 1555(-)]|eukprot:XP_018284777.1 hypothetical protein PHYBLDRAFT_183810 [Phycomyces blakesleeanus NRRL 1555(-)]
MKIQSAVILLTACWAQWTHGCGMSVHNEITHRSLEIFHPQSSIEAFYKAIVTKHTTFAQAGSFFPDWGYNCLGYSRQSEDAHWPPFIKSAVEYVRESYPRSEWTEPHVQGLIAFVFSIMSHGVADVKWHSLGGLEEYFIHAMAQNDFYGNIDEAHKAADTGAEFTLRHSSRLSYMSDTWQVPLIDLINIYARIYEATNETALVPTKDHLQHCMTAAFAAAKLDAKLGHHMFAYYGSQSPFLIEQLNDYHKGGLQDMSASVAECYSDMVHAFENTDNLNHTILCAQYFDSTNLLADKPRCATVTQLPEYSAICQPLQHYDPKRGILTLTLPTNQCNIPLPGKKHIPSFPSLSHSPLKPLEPLFRYQDGATDNTPAENEGIRHCSPLSIPDQKSSNSALAPFVVTLSLPISSVAIGHETAVGDYDADGQLDLAISAPYHDNIIPLDDDDYDDDYEISGGDSSRSSSSSSGSDRSNRSRAPKLMAGAVFILNDTRARFNRIAQQDKHIKINDIRKQSQVVLQGNATHGRFGWSMATIDFNQDGVDDLAVAAPFSDNLQGHVDIFLGNPRKGLSSTPDIRIRVQAVVGHIEGLGLSIMGLDLDGNGYRDLVIGCPYCSVLDQIQAGAVYVFLGRKGDHVSKSDIFPDWVLTNPQPMPYEHFGSSIDFIPPLPHTAGLLLIGAPGHKHSELQQAGRVYGFKISPSFSPALWWTMTGTNEFQQFGRIVLVGKTEKTKGFLAVSSPSEETRVAFDKHWQAGVVRLYNANTLLLDTQQDNRGVVVELGVRHALLKQLDGRETSGSLGTSIAFHEQDKEVSLWVGEPMSEQENGRVYRWIIQKDSIQCLYNTPSLARFGSHIGHTGTNAMSVTSQHYSDKARFSGAIHLIQPRA